MQIVKHSSKDMLTLWGYENLAAASPTARFFCRNIDSGNAVFWALETNGRIVGELYVFYHLEDPDFADGKSAAYLCAFRIEKAYRGQGYGSRLMNTVLADLKAGGFCCATVGVGFTEESNIRMYQHLGFSTTIKKCFSDPCALDENMQPKPDEGFWLLSKVL